MADFEKSRKPPVPYGRFWKKAVNPCTLTPNNGLRPKLKSGNSQADRYGSSSDGDDISAKTAIRLMDKILHYPL